jgi:hypothetical protein
MHTYTLLCCIVAFSPYALGKGLGFVALLHPKRSSPFKKTLPKTSWCSPVFTCLLSCSFSIQYRDRNKW